MSRQILKLGTEIVPQTSVIFKQLTHAIAREDFITRISCTHLAQVIHWLLLAVYDYFLRSIKPGYLPFYQIFLEDFININLLQSQCIRHTPGVYKTRSAIDVTHFTVNATYN
jgi:hypothetical protein